VRKRRGIKRIDDDESISLTISEPVPLLAETGRPRVPGKTLELRERALGTSEMTPPLLMT
jgi:hypothetical protein